MAKSPTSTNAQLDTSLQAALKALANPALVGAIKGGSATINSDAQKAFSLVLQTEGTRLLQAATTQMTSANVFAEGVQVMHGSATQQKLAVDRQFTASEHLAKVNLQTGQYGTGKNAQLSYQDAIYQAQNTKQSGLNQIVSGQYGALQDRVTLDTLKHLPTAADIRTLSGFIRANAQQLGMSPTQAQISILQLQQSASQAVVKALPTQLIRPTNIDAGNVFSADFGGSVASLAGANRGPDRLVAQLERTVAYLQEQNAILRSELGLSKSSDSSLKVIAEATVKTASNTRSEPTGANPFHKLRSVSNHNK